MPHTISQPKYYTAKSNKTLEPKIEVTNSTKTQTHNSKLSTSFQNPTYCTKNKGLTFLQQINLIDYKVHNYQTP